MRAPHTTSLPPCTLSSVRQAFILLYILYYLIETGSPGGLRLAWHSPRTPHWPQHHPCSLCLKSCKCWAYKCELLCLDLSSSQAGMIAPRFVPGSEQITAPHRSCPSKTIIFLQSKRSANHNETSAGAVLFYTGVGSAALTQQFSTRGS